LTLAILAGAWLASGCASSAESDRGRQQSIEAVVERYIQTHPEIIEQSLLSLEAKRAEEAKARQKVALARHQQELLHDPASPVSGNPAGEVTLIEFFDYRCGFCKRAAGAVTQLQKDDPRVRVVYKDLPILGEPSELAAKAALAAQLQHKHQAFHEAVLASKNEMTRDELFRIAGDLHLDPSRLEADMANPQWQTVIDRNRALAMDLGINGTPGFIVGTELVPGVLDLNGLKELIARAEKGK
jgi:protein-disulfide isomerase